MASALRSSASQLAALAARSAGAPTPWASQLAVLVAYAPPQSQLARAQQAQLLVARSSGETNVTAEVSQAALLIAYATGVPITQVATSWDFILDGHRLWVVSLGPEGDWAYDTTTKQWCQLFTQGFPGLNFTHGAMWGLRIMGGDLLYPFLYEMAADQPNDEGWRPVFHAVTGGIMTRSPNGIGVANFRLAASAGALNDVSTDVNLSYSDDNGETWSDLVAIAVAQGANSVQLIWPALGSFSAPGRIFSITDSGGMLSIYGADAALNNYDEDDNSAASGKS